MTNRPDTVEALTEALAQNDFSDYYNAADEIKKEIYGNDIYIRAIIEFSNHCKMDCRYCGINCKNTSVKRYRLSPENIVDIGKKAFDVGYKTLVMQSGEDPYFTVKLLGEMVKELKKTGLIITLSCGEMSFDDYQYLKNQGADRYLLKHECSDEEIYSSLHGNSTLENRILCLRNLKRIGYETGSGFMIGLPGQTLRTIAQDILLLKDIPCDMAGIGPFIPHPMTPLKDLPSGSTELTKRALALTRIVMGRINLPATTSLGVLSGRDRDDIFSCGANVIMKKVTPEPYKSMYEIYPSNLQPTDIKADRQLLETSIKSLGYNPV